MHPPDPDDDLFVDRGCEFLRDSGSHPGYSIDFRDVIIDVIPG